MPFVIGFGILSVLALVTAVLASSPAEGRSRSRAASRRMRYVRRHPLYANSGDIERLLSAGGLADDDVRLVSARAEAAGIKPFTLWLCLQCFDVRTLAVVVAGDIGHDELIDRLASRDVSDLAELEVFARLNGLSLAPAVAGAAEGGGTNDPRLQAGQAPPTPPTPRRARRNGIAA